MSNLLFSYGLLLPSFETPVRALLDQHLSIGPKAKLQAKLYDCGSYPAAIPSSNSADWVYGQLYNIESESQFSLFHQLDHYEGDEYLRKLLKVQIIATEEICEAWAYIYVESVVSLPQIESGDFLKHSNLNC